MAKMISLKTEEDTLSLGARLAGRMKAGDIILLFGGLGAGKTCFARGVASRFGKGDAVSSPTFALMNIYDTSPPIYHFDLYRIQSAEEVEDAGFAEFFFGRGISLIEWPEAAMPLIRSDFAAKITFGYDSESRFALIEGELEDAIDDDTCS